MPPFWSVISTNKVTNNQNTITGDATAAHIFTAVHRAIIENLILPFTPGSEKNLVLVIDDSIFIAEDEAWVAAYDLRYREVLKRLNLGVQEYDPSLRKSFPPSSEGEVLGYWLSASTRTWMVAQTKIDDFLRQSDKIMDPRDPSANPASTLKTFQKVEGKLADMAKLSPFIRIKMMIISAELHRAVSVFEAENKLHERNQRPRTWLSTRAKQDLQYLRAVVAQLRNFPLPLTDPRPSQTLSAQILVYCDASGTVTETAYCGVLITRGSLHPADIALAYEIPHHFLQAHDTEHKRNCSNSMLLELLSILALVVDLGPELTGRSILFVTDSLSLTTIIHNRRVPDSINVNFALQTLLEATLEAQITLRLKWKPRRSCMWTTAADDLSHAHFYKLPTAVSPDTHCKALRLPRPVLHTLLQAATIPGTGFPTLRNNVIDYWNSLGWCTRFWSKL